MRPWRFEKGGYQHNLAGKKFENFDLQQKLTDYKLAKPIWNGQFEEIVCELK